MARKKLVFVNDAEEENQTPDKADEDPSTEEGTPLVSPKKIKLTADREGVGSKSGEYGYACSSPSASDFIVMPAVKPSRRKKNASSSKIFSDEDEIALLNGLAVFWANGRNNKWTEFYQFIKSDLANQFSKTQVSEKVRKLRIKFETNFERARANGGRIDFSNSHETNVFGLCRALWGDEKGAVEEDEEAHKIERKGEEVGDENEESNKMQKKRKEVDEEHRQNNASEKQKQVDEDDEGNNSAEKGKQQVMEISHEDFQSAFPLFYASFDSFRYPNIVKEKCNLIPREKAQEVEEKCRELKAEALRLELKRIDLIKRDLQDHLQKV